MSSRTLKSAFSTTLPIMAAYWLIGLGYGLYATRLGLAWWFPAVTAMLVFSGSVEFILASMMLGAFAPAAVFGMAFLVGARHLFYGVSMLDRFRGAGWRKPFMIALLTDETFAVTYRCQIPEGVDKHDFQLAVSVLDWLYWLTGTLAGVALANMLKRFDLSGVEFIMTAMFTAIYAENWRSEERHAGSIIGVAASVLALVIFGAQNFMIPAMGMILVALVLLRRELS